MQRCNADHRNGQVLLFCSGVYFRRQKERIMLQISHLTKTYGKKNAVDDLSLEIRPGEMCIRDREEEEARKREQEAK